MNDLRKAAQQALAAIILANRCHRVTLSTYPPKDAWLSEGVSQRLHDASDAIRAALEGPEVEPVALIGTNGELAWIHRPRVLYSKPVPLYACLPSQDPPAPRGGRPAPETIETETSYEIIA